jgi:hypothetical protein
MLGRVNLRLKSRARLEKVNPRVALMRSKANTRSRKGAQVTREDEIELMSCIICGQPVFVIRRSPNYPNPFQYVGRLRGTLGCHMDSDGHHYFTGAGRLSHA